MAAGDIIEIVVQAREDDTHTSQSLTLDGARFRIDFYTNKSDGCWYLDLFDSEDAPMVLGIGLVTGLDLLFPYRYLPVPSGVLFVNDHIGERQDPTLNSFFEDEMNLYYQTTT
jgi:hypothetical protein